MNEVTRLITDHIDIWTSGDTEKKSGRGRSATSAGLVYGIKKLRELILELAVRGKLVPQDPNDEPASELLKRIEEERKGFLKKEKEFSGIKKDNYPFKLPTSWVWVRLSQIGHDWGQAEPESSFTYIEVSAIDSNLGTVSTPEIVEAENAPSRARKIVRAGTVIYSTVRPYLLNAAVIDRDFIPPPIASTAFAVIHPFCQMPPRYILSYLRSPVFVRYVESVQTGIAYPAINDKQFFSGLIPLPPLEEQHRIVAKVDELMALCDQLEAGHTAAAAAHEKLVVYLLDTLINSENSEDFAANWYRIAVHFDTLFTTEKSIDVLKKTILQLALMGKLVSQNKQDEPAFELLKKIENEKKRLVRKNVKKNTTSQNSEYIKSLVEKLPKGWVQTNFNNIGTLISGQHLKPQEYFDKPRTGSIPYITGPADFGNESPIPCRHTFETRAISYKGDILITVKGSGVGKINRVDQERLVISRQLMAFRPIIISLDFVQLLLRNMEEKFQKLSIGIAIPGISREDILYASVLLPPLAEQSRIVEKVDKLTALCDDLKSRLRNANQLQQNLADTLVAQAA